MVIKPFGSRVHVKLEKIGEAITAGGIHLPQKHAEGTRFGVVIACGPRCETVIPGDRVILSYHSGTGIDNPLLDAHYDTDRIVEEDELLGEYGE